MATLVLASRNNGTLQQVQIGPADLVATVAAAHAAWGWLGGLRGILRILNMSVKSSEKQNLRQIFEAFEPTVHSCRILGQHGLESFKPPEDDPFGPTQSSKLVGMTLCALAYTMQPKSAINIFMDFFVEALFKNGLSDVPGSKEALYHLLIDNHPVILNEGAIYGLPERFQNAISRLRLTTGLKASGHPRNSQNLFASDVALIQGFLRWLIRNNSETYFTRSGAVARIAACLRCVGYMLGEVTVWDGAGSRPALHRTVVLVTGGSCETDNLMDENTFKSTSIDLITHYKWNTVGAMLWNSLLQDCGHFHTTLQEDFDNINDLVEHNLDFQWAYVNDRMEELQAFPLWGNPKFMTTPTSTSIATIFFPESVDQISGLYQRISNNDKYLKAAKARKDPRHSTVKGPSKELQRFQTMTASICLAVLGRIGGPGFTTLQHSTTIDLSTMDHLKWLCGEVDAILSGGCGMSRVITALASIHCAMEFPVSIDLQTGEFQPGRTESEQSGSMVVGWRNGRYAILPNLLFSMDAPLQQSILDLRSEDRFIANLPTRKSGAICCPIGLPGAI
ncbi:hypothetical protein ACEPPN_011217 [Leptodophora sp. 'Broadleaf-Isolate-01']